MYELNSRSDVVIVAQSMIMNHIHKYMRSFNHMAIKYFNLARPYTPAKVVFYEHLGKRDDAPDPLLYEIAECRVIPGIKSTAECVNDI
ncbi:MAG: hypothetical protein D3916_17635, partial [Candidatus Electrothrix sp. MAN1_4]|nr:hypothetical protein [Candidatus Electrothrix sp. MAN1_4]